MDAFLALNEERRRLLLQQAAEEAQISAQAVEKDYWICLVLRELFQLEGIGGRLTFKGGTSLSKGWGLIERFSEDLDVVIDREVLGFGGEEAPEAAKSRSEGEKRIDLLLSACRRYIDETLAPALRGQFEVRLAGTGNWGLNVDSGDPLGQTILFEYPTLFGGNEYLRSVVRVELGARSDTEPSASPSISPYLALVPVHELGNCSFEVRTVTPERTFWEKAMLLHEECFRDGKPRDRLSRHYYDLWCLDRRGIADRAIADSGLAQRVASHRALFFRKNKQTHDSMKPGSFRLTPTEDSMADWARDYRAMREAMLFGERPEFNEIIRVIQGLEGRINGRATPK